MCSQVTCPRCHKPDWRGCGAHVEQVLGHLPKDQRCKCREQPKEAQPPAGPERKARSWFPW